MRRRSKYSKIPVFMIVCVFLGLLITAVIFMFVSFVMTKIDISKSVTQLISVAALALGTYFGGFICAKKYRKNGLIRGAVCGFSIFLIVTLLGSIFAGSLLSFSASSKLMLVIITGAIGGAVGVNSKRRRY